MSITKKIIKINKEEYDRLKEDYGTLFDLYFSDNEYYVIGTLDDLKGCFIDISSKGA
jgi:hypothetical protein